MPYSQEQFKEQLLNYASYKVLEAVHNDDRRTYSETAQQFIEHSLKQNRRTMGESLRYLDTLSEAERNDGFSYAQSSDEVKTVLFSPREEPKKPEGVVFKLRDIAKWWHEDYLRYKNGAAEASSPTKTEPSSRQNLFAVHSSTPVYDIGETIARGLFTLPADDHFPSADIIGNTTGRIELLPFWDHENNKPLTPQNINLVLNTNKSEFLRMQEEAVKIATSYNEEMATYFYAMDAYWLTHAKKPDDYVSLRINELLQYTGKKPVKAHGRYTNAYRSDQLQRAGLMVYGMGFSMVEIEKTIIKGTGARTHYRRLWDVSDMYMMETLDAQTYIESLTYRPNEFFRNTSFGSRRETALLMSKVLSLDYEKMVVARRLGRYYTWLWRDRAYSGKIDAPISCARLLERTGIAVVKGKERYARRSLEQALDRLESEGIIAQWILITSSGEPADMSERISFSRWLDMKISVAPPDMIMTHYSANLNAMESKGLPSPLLDIAQLQAERKRRKFTLSMLSEATGVEISTLSRIATGRTKKPREEHVKAINKWLQNG